MVPRSTSSMLGWVAAVIDTESPSQLNPAVIQRMWTSSTLEALRKLGEPFPAMSLALRPPARRGPERMSTRPVPGRCVHGRQGKVPRSCSDRNRVHAGLAVAARGYPPPVSEQGAQIIVCPNCGRKNRVPDAAPGKPGCAICHSPLPWSVAANDDTFDRVAVTADLPVL